MKRICAITMVRNDDDFLRKWIAYYGSQIGEENLYVYLDGLDQAIPDGCGKANIIVKERVEGNVAHADRGRIDFISSRAEGLLERYDLVIGTDVDEFLAVDPAVSSSLAEYLSRLNVAPSVSGLGIDVGQHLPTEQAIDWSLPLLSQRRYGYLSSRYTKTSVISRPVAWGSGFHRVRHHNFRIDTNLFLFHFGSADLERIKSRMTDSDLLSKGWERHLAKRARTIDIVTNIPAKPWMPTVEKARRWQTFVRPIFAWNKPSMLWRKVVVEIPKRFRSIV